MDGRLILYYYRKWTNGDKSSAFSLIDTWVGDAVRGFVIFCLREERRRIRGWLDKNPNTINTIELMKEYDNLFGRN